MRFLSMLLTVLLLAACGQGFSGTYTDELGVQKYTFKNNGKLTISAMGVEQETEFTREGDILRIGKGGPVSMVINIHSDGSLSALGGVMKLRKAE